MLKQAQVVRQGPGKLPHVGYAILLSSVMSLMGCAGTTEKMGPDEDDPLGAIGPINSQDFRSVCFEMAQSLVRIPQIQNSRNAPKIAFTKVENASSELFSTDDFLYKMRTELNKNAAGKIEFLDRDAVDDILREREAKDRGEITTSGNKPLYGADYFLAGRVESIRRSRGQEETVYFRFSFRLTDASTSVIVWENDWERKTYRKVGTYDR